MKNRDTKSIKYIYSKKTKKDRSKKKWTKVKLKFIDNNIFKRKLINESKLIIKFKKKQKYITFISWSVLNDKIIY